LRPSPPDPERRVLRCAVTQADAENEAPIRELRCPKASGQSIH
jgi:hypothetical protein